MTRYAKFVCECAIDEAIQQHASEIVIKSTERIQQVDKSGNNGASYVVYAIQFQGKECKRRYSDFDSFRLALTRLYPDVLVPPIPEKHSITEYAIAQKRSHDEPNLIEKRQRLLQRFLVRVASHPRLSREHVFHRFLDGNTSWTEVLQGPPLAMLPKDPSSSSFLSLTSTTTSHTLQYPDPQFAALELAADQHADHANTRLDRPQRRLLRKLEELSADLGELGAGYQNFSSSETEHVAKALEWMSSVSELTCARTQELAYALEINFAEHMHEYAQYTHIAKSILRYRHMKHVQLEMTRNTLENKRAMLHNLQKVESKAQELEASMNGLSEAPETAPLDRRHEDEDFETRSIEDGFAAIDHLPGSSSSQPQEADNEETYPSSANASAIRASRNRYKQWSSPRKLLNAVSTTLQGMIDVDPEATRRNQINRLKDTVAELEESVKAERQDLEEISRNIQQELEAFEKQRSSELRTMMIAYAKIHLKYCEENAVSWKEAREQMDQIFVPQALGG